MRYSDPFRGKFQEQKHLQIGNIEINLQMDAKPALGVGGGGPFASPIICRQDGQKYSQCC